MLSGTVTATTNGVSEAPERACAGRQCRGKPVQHGRNCQPPQGLFTREEGRGAVRRRLSGGDERPPLI